MPSEPYQLYYWPGIPGRGEYVRLVLHAAGAPYIEMADTLGFEGILQAAGFAGAEGPYTPFAPPFLKHGDLIIFQTANVCAYLAERHELAPAADKDRLFARGLALTIEDLVREIHDTHHPIAVSRYYEAQRDTAVLRAADFRDNRLPVFMRYFENQIVTNGAGLLIGDRLSYCDLALFQTVAGLKYAFPKTMSSLAASMPQVLDLCEAVGSEPRLETYLAARAPFNQDGIFRHYAELDARDA